jgi:hypothetical protein
VPVVRRPCSVKAATKALRVESPSFPMARETSTPTVDVAMPSSYAMSLFECPRLALPGTSCRKVTGCDVCRAIIR